MKQYRVLQFGLGPIGVGVARAVVESPNLSLVGAVDMAETLRGQEVAPLLGLAEPLGVRVRPTVEEALADSPADVAVHCAGSFLAQATDQFVALAEAGLNVVSTCEELSYPYFHHPAEARRIDEAAKAHGVSVLATGVNPGFVMDLLPIVLSTVSRNVQRVSVHRVVNAGSRRIPLQRKVGAGMTVEEFEAKAAAGKLGHVGLVESVAMISDALGLGVERITEELRPQTATRRIEAADRLIEPGQVAGINQRARGFVGEEVVIDLHLEMYVGADDPQDRVVLIGTPDLRVTIEGGTPGDAATVSAVICAIPRVVAAPPGLWTVKDRW